MQRDNTQSDIKTIIKTLQYLFLNKQLDQFITVMEREILPYVDQLKHHNKEDNKCKMNKKKEQNTDNEQEKQHKTNKDSNQLRQPEQPLIKKRKQQVKQALKNSKIKLIEKYQDMKLIVSKLQHITLKIQEPMLQSANWKINKLNNKSRIAVRTKGTQVQVKFEGLLQASIENLIIMIYLIELYKECVPFCSGSKNIYEPSPLEKIALLDFKFPFLTERFAYFHGIAIDRLTKNGKLYIYAEGVTKQEDLITKVFGVPAEQYKKKMTKSVPLDVKNAVCEISDAGNGEYLFRAYAFVDTHMPQLPQKAVNYIVKSMGGWIFDKIIKKANNFKGSPWQKQVQENEKRQKKDMFYTWLRERISNWSKSTQVAKQSKI